MRVEMELRCGLVVCTRTRLFMNHFLVYKFVKSSLLETVLKVQTTSSIYAMISSFFCIRLTYIVCVARDITQRGIKKPLCGGSDGFTYNTPESRQECATVHTCMYVVRSHSVARTITVIFLSQSHAIYSVAMPLESTQYGMYEVFSHGIYILIY